MRKKMGDEDLIHRRDREESLSIVHRKAAALAWYKHGRKGTSVLGSAKTKMQTPLSHSLLAARHHGIARSSTHVGGANSNDDDDDDDDDDTLIDADGNGLCSPFFHAPCHNLSPVPQASRFKAEALALQSSSSLPHTAHTNSQQLINMNTGQSLALLSMLPHQQSQKCFNLWRKGYAASSSNGHHDKDNAAAAWDCGSSLYDSFELLCLSNQLGRCLTTVNATAMASSVPSSSKLLKQLTSPTMPGPPLQPSYIPRSLYALPQFIIPNSLVKKASKRRSSLIHPVFSMPSSAIGSPPCPSLSALACSSSSHGNKSSSNAEDSTRKKAESGGFRRVFNSLLKSLHMKDDDDTPKRLNLSEELDKLPKVRPLGMSRGPPLLQSGTAMASKGSTPTSLATAMASREAPTSSSSSGTNTALKKSPTLSSFSAAAAAAMASKRSPTATTSPSVQNYYHYHHHFRNEGFRTSSIKPSKFSK